MSSTQPVASSTLDRLPVPVASLSLGFSENQFTHLLNGFGVLIRKATSAEVRRRAAARLEAMFEHAQSCPCLPLGHAVVRLLPGRRSTAQIVAPSLARRMLPSPVKGFGVGKLWVS